MSGCCFCDYVALFFSEEGLHERGVSGYNILLNFLYKSRMIC